MLDLPQPSTKITVAIMSKQLEGNSNPSLCNYTAYSASVSEESSDVDQSWKIAQ